MVVAGGRRGENDRKQNYLAYNEKERLCAWLHVLADKGWVVYIVQPISTTRKMLAF